MNQTPTQNMSDRLFEELRSIGKETHVLITKLKDELAAMTQERDKLQAENDSLCRELDVMQQELDGRPLP